MRLKNRSSVVKLGVAAAVLLVVWAGFGLPHDSHDSPGNASAPAAAAGPTYREIHWDDLVPSEWDPIKRFQRRDMAALDDGSLRAEQLQREMRSLWDNAPTVGDMEGAQVKLPGYVVPLDEVDGALTQFLLVPYFGACIHTPPPPANQIVLVSARGARGVRTMDTVWVSGRLSTARQATEMGTSGYRLAAAKVERYLPPGR